MKSNNRKTTSNFRLHTWLGNVILTLNFYNQWKGYQHFQKALKYCALIQTVKPAFLTQLCFMNYYPSYSHYSYHTHLSTTTQVRTSRKIHWKDTGLPFNMEKMQEWCIQEEWNTVDEHLMVLLCLSPNLSSSDSNTMVQPFSWLFSKRDGCPPHYLFTKQEEKWNRFLNLKILRRMLLFTTTVGTVQQH